MLKKKKHSLIKFYRENSTAKAKIIEHPQSPSETGWNLNGMMTIYNSY